MVKGGALMNRKIMVCGETYLVIMREAEHVGPRSGRCDRVLLRKPMDDKLFLTWDHGPHRGPGRFETPLEFGASFKATYPDGRLPEFGYCLYQ